MGILDFFRHDKKDSKTPFYRVQMLNDKNSSFTTVQNAYESDYVRSAIDAIARNGAKLTPRHIMRVNDETTNINDGLSKLLSLEPNRYMNSYSFFYKIITQKFLRNNAFVYVDKLGSRVLGLYPVIAERVEFLEDNNHDIFCKFWFYNGSFTVLPYENIIHLRRFYCDNDFLGESSQAFGDKVLLSQVSDQGISNAIKTTSGVRGILNFTGILNEKDKKKYKDNFVADYMNLSTNGSGVVATDTRVDYKPITTNPQTVNKAQLDYIKNAIYEYFGINEEIVKSKWSEDSWNAFYEGVLEPLAIEMSVEFTSKIFGKNSSHQIMFEANRLQYASNTTKVNLIKEGMPLGVFSVNEAREVFNLAPVDNGDKRYQTLNVVDVNLANEYQNKNKGTKDGKEN